MTREEIVATLRERARVLYEGKELSLIHISEHTRH